MADKSTVFREVQKFLSKGQYSKAIELWEGYVKENPDGTIYNTIGDLYYRSGNKQKAIEYFHKAADFFVKEGFLTKAQALYKKILNLDPQDGKALFFTGNIYEEKGLVTDAIKYYLSSIDAFAKSNDRDGLQRASERITKLSPDNIPLRVKLAEYFQKEGFTENTAQEYVNIGQICEQKGEIEKARQFYEKAIEIYPKYEPIYKVIPDFYISLELYDKAIELLRKGQELFPDNINLKLKHAEVLIKKGSTSEAKEILKEIIVSKPPKEIHTITTRILVDAYLKEGNIDLAWENLKTILLELITSDKREETLKLLERFRETYPLEVSQRLIEIYKELENTEGLFNEYVKAGDYLKQNEKFEQALSYYKEAQKINPDAESIKERIDQIEIALGATATPKAEEKPEKSTDEKLIDADIFIRYGLFEEALDILEKLKVEDPENIEVHKRLKNIYLELNDKEQAVTECLILSKIYDKNGDYEYKEQVLKEAFDINPEDPRLVEMTQKQEEEPLISTTETEFVGTTLPDFEETAFTEEPLQKDTSFEFTPTEPPSITESETEDLNELIAEAEFYYRQGLYQDALSVYEKLLSIQPDNQDFKNKVSEIKERLAPAEESLPETSKTEDVVKESELSGLFESKEEIPSQKSETEDTLDKSFYDQYSEEQQEEELVTEELDFKPEEEDLKAPEPELTNEVMEIFEEFKKGIAEELEEEDYETHYNLGIAYKEMGLLDDAIKEFQIAKKDPNRKVHVMSMLGVCYMEKQLYSLAIDAYKEALENMKEKDESYWGTKFDLATAYEKNGDLKAALDIFVEIYGWDSKFRDVDKKVNNLKKLLSEDKGEAEIAEEEPPKNKDRISYI